MALNAHTGKFTYFTHFYINYEIYALFLDMRLTFAMNNLKIKPLKIDIMGQMTL